ncbi:PEP-CTERM putative exosortase interaction domain-containing protein [Opitutaceae bacterium TAV1]|nr:PEP-CTERM putative exosortase interaction domain-containing protein [Opitutaceae bacterium TAV1]
MNKTILSVIAGGVFAALVLCTSSKADDFTWSATDTGLWSDGANWVGGVAPSGDDIALLTPTGYGQLNLDTDVSIGSFTASLATSGTWNIRAYDATRSLTIDSLVKGGSGYLYISNSANNSSLLNLTIGSITHTTSRLALGEANTAVKINSVTVTGKTTVSGSAILYANATTAVFDEVSLSGTAAFEIYANRGGSSTSHNTGGATVAGLSGTSGQVRTIYASLTTQYVDGTLTLDPAAGAAYSFGGTIVNRGSSGGVVTLSLVKDGAGTQHLSGASTYTGTTTVNAGALYVNGSHLGTVTDTGTAVATGAGTYTVNDGGLLGGIGTITTADADVVIKAGGKLEAGDPTVSSGIGTLTFALGTGKLDIKEALSSAGALLFDLGSIAESDRIVLTTGSIDIGTGLLGLDSFSFTVPGSLEEGTYTLLSSSQSIIGTLGANLAGVLDGREVALAFANGNRDIVLTVAGAAVPEPSTLAALSGVGALAVAFLARRRFSRPVPGAKR